MSDIRDSYTNHTPYTHGGVEDFMDQTRPAAAQLLPDSRSGEARSCNVRGGGHGVLLHQRWHRHSRSDHRPRRGARLPSIQHSLCGARNIRGAADPAARQRLPEALREDYRMQKLDPEDEPGRLNVVTTKKLIKQINAWRKRQPLERGLKAARR